MRWSQFELDAHNAKHVDFDQFKNKADDGKESILRGKIEKYCRDNGWYCFHDNSRNVNREGHPDLVIAMPDSRTLWIEIKAKNGKLSSEQKIVLSKLKGLKHESYVLNNFEAFIQIINKKLRNFGGILLCQ
jgi:hypothetical protein